MTSQLSGFKQTRSKQSRNERTRTQHLWYALGAVMLMACTARNYNSAPSQQTPDNTRTPATAGSPIPVTEDAAAEARDTMSSGKLATQTQQSTKTQRSKKTIGAAIAHTKAFSSVVDYQRFLLQHGNKGKETLDKAALQLTYDALMQQALSLADFPKGQAAAQRPIQDPNIAFEYPVPEPTEPSFFSKDLANQAYIGLSIRYDIDDSETTEQQINSDILPYLRWLKSSNAANITAESKAVPGISSLFLNSKLFAWYAKSNRVLVGTIDALALRPDFHPCRNTLRFLPWLVTNTTGTTQRQVRMPKDVTYPIEPVLIIITPSAHVPWPQKKNKTDGIHQDDEGITFYDVDLDGIDDIAWSKGGIDELFYALFVNIAGQWQVRQNGTFFPLDENCF